jgi:RNA polymerase sigma factor (sigma-70 family)
VGRTSFRRAAAQRHSPVRPVGQGDSEAPGFSTFPLFELSRAARTLLGMPALSEAADSDLLAMAGSEPEALGELFRRYSRSVYAYCARRTGNLDLAEDLTSVVFMEAFRRRRKPQLSNESALPWLLGGANNVVRNANRSLRRYRTALDRIPVQADGASPEESTMDRLGAQEALARALEAISALSQGEQDAVLLVLWSEFTYADAATALGIPVGTVRSRLASARSKFKDSAPVTSTTLTQ